jgi:predicted P-loop ATPase
MVNQVSKQAKVVASAINYLLAPYYKDIQESQTYDKFAELDGYYIPSFLQSLHIRHYEHFIIQKRINRRIKYNEFLDLVEVDDKPIKADDLYREFTIGKFPCDIKSDRKKIIPLIVDIAKSNPYHPVRDYLKNAYESNGYTGNYKHLLKILRQDDDNHLALRYLEVFGTGAVHRIMSPGCIMRYMLVLFSKHQNIGKSLFCAELSNGWFNDDFHDFKNKDELSKLHNHWIVELSEVDKLFKGRSASEIKAAVSTRTDTYRKPYGVALESHPRPSIFVGTTNENQILNDSTGNTRFMMIEIPGSDRIDLSWIRANRDKIWADFYHLAIVGGMLPMLSEVEENLQSSHNKEFEVGDAWEDDIRVFMSSASRLRIGASMSEILVNVLHKQIGDHSKSDEYRISEILKRIGCECKQKRWTKGGEKSRRWIMINKISYEFEQSI